MSESMEAPARVELPYFPELDRDTEDHLVGSIETAEERIWLVGLTCGYYLDDGIRPVLRQKAEQMPVFISFLDPRSDLWAIRYEMEPHHARYHDPERFLEEVVEPYADLAARHPPTEGAGFHVTGYRFWPPFGIEVLDEVMRVRLYGLEARGTESPILLPEPGSPAAAYFEEQVRAVLTADEHSEVRAIAGASG